MKMDPKQSIRERIYLDGVLYNTLVKRRTIYTEKATGIKFIRTMGTKKYLYNALDGGGLTFDSHSKTIPVFGAKALFR